MSLYEKPLPEPSDETEGFWSAAKRHEIAIQQCSSCREYRHPPLPVCPRCHSWDFTWSPVSPNARLASWTVVHHVVYPAFKEESPYVVAKASLEDCPHVLLTTNIVECEPKDIRMGMPLQAVFDDVTPEITLIKFRPA